GLAGNADSSIYDLDMTGPCVLVTGSEGRGIRRMTRELCDRVAAIPMRGAAESLNVSVAAGVTLFEASRQRRLAPPAGSIAPSTRLK
ncbi:MAG: TrmH family RNA methyltransferase, partial [Pseudomonadota bacterium]|nr:TrmH family RNA methyltransferase [Pseudomonadota bacterium]